MPTVGSWGGAFSYERGTPVPIWGFRVQARVQALALKGEHTVDLLVLDFTEMCSGSEAGSYSRLIDFVYHSTLGLRVIKKREVVCS